MKNNLCRLLKKLGGFYPPVLILLSGCSSLPIYERTYTPDNKQIIARENDIEIQIAKKQNHWIVFYVNNTTEPKCIGATWKVFDLIPRVLNQLIYVSSHRTIQVGYFEEQTWKFDKLDIIVGGSALVDKFDVRTPYKNRKNCIFPKGKII